jgi:hypothetical protein
MALKIKSFRVPFDQILMYFSTQGIFNFIFQRKLIKKLMLLKCGFFLDCKNIYLLLIKIQMTKIDIMIDGK